MYLGRLMWKSAQRIQLPTPPPMLLINYPPGLLSLTYELQTTSYLGYSEVSGHISETRAQAR